MTDWRGTAGIFYLQQCSFSLAGVNGGLVGCYWDLEGEKFSSVYASQSSDEKKDTAHPSIHPSAAENGKERPCFVLEISNKKSVLYKC